MDYLTTEERAAIDAYSGPITRVETGESGLPQVIWDGKALRYDDPERARKMFVQSRTRQRPPHKTSPHVVERREAIRAMVEAGHTGPEIADALGIPVRMVYSDNKAMGLRLPRVHFGRKPKEQKRSPRKEASEQFRARLRELCDGTRTVRELSDMTGAHYTTVKSAVDAMGLKVKPGVSGKHLRQNPAIQKRRDKIPAMHAAGMSQRAIARELGVSSASIRLDFKALGLTAGRAE